MIFAQLPEEVCHLPPVEEDSPQEQVLLRVGELKCFLDLEFASVADVALSWIEVTE